MDDQFWMLRMYSWFTKTMSLLFLLTGLALEGITIYGWGRFTAFYDMINTAWKAIADSYNSYNTTGISLPAALAPIPIWPLLVVIIVILMFTIFFSFTLWAGSDWIEIRITLAKEERESHAILTKAMDKITRDLTVVADYFSSLPSPHK